MRGKNVFYGIGFSTLKDSKKAAETAAQAALKELKKVPTISFAFFTSNHDPYKISKGLQSKLKGEFVGGSADSVIYNENFFIEDAILVVSIQSDYLHVGVASNDNVSKDPYTIAKKTITNALKKLSIDKYIDPYLLFSRMKNTKTEWMLKIPSFNVMLFTRGMHLPSMGEETKIIQGISDVVGAHVPVWGGSFGVPLENLFTGKPYEIYSLHSGKVMKNGLIILVNVMSLVYGHSIAHGTQKTHKIGSITRVSGNGFVIEKISGKNPLEWYAKQVGLPLKKFKEQILMITQRHPLGIPDNFGNFIIRAGGVPAGKNLAFVAPFIEGMPVYLMDASDKNLMKATNYIVSDLKNYTKEKQPAITFAIPCASRRVTLGKKFKDELKALKKGLKGSPLVGFTCFGEVGSRPGYPTLFEHLTLNVFSIYDKLLQELKS